MDELNVFVSVGATVNDIQESFVRSVEDRLRSEGLIPHTVGRNHFSSDAPLKTVTDLMDKCSGALVIALERTYFPAGIEKRGGANETTLSEIKLPTSFNQIEAAMAYTRGLPLMVIVEQGLKKEGLLEPGYDWYVQSVRPNVASLNTLEFNGILASWKAKIIQSASKKKTLSSSVNPSELTVGDLIKGLKASQLWSILIALTGLVAGAFALGAKLFPSVMP